MSTSWLCNRHLLILLTCFIRWKVAAGPIKDLHFCRWRSIASSINLNNHFRHCWHSIRSGYQRSEFSTDLHGLTETHHAIAVTVQITSYAEQRFLSTGQHFGGWSNWSPILNAAGDCLPLESGNDSIFQWIFGEIFVVVTRLWLKQFKWYLFRSRTC